MTSPTSLRWIPCMGHCDFDELVPPRTSAESGSSTWWSTTPRMSIPGSAPHARTLRDRLAISTCGPTTPPTSAAFGIIFIDTEESNWTFDPVRRQFFAPISLTSPISTTRIRLFRGHSQRGPLGRDAVLMASVSTPPLPSKKKHQPHLPATHELSARVRTMLDTEFLDHFAGGS